jgi:sugar phosphate isomerase/epimerase
MIRQSFCAPIFLDAVPNPRVLFDMARATGYVATEFWEPPKNFEALCDAAHAAGLAVSSFTGHACIERGLNLIANHGRIFSELSRSIALAQRLQIAGIIVFSGTRNVGQPDDEARANTVEALRALAPLAEESGGHVES